MILAFRIPYGAVLGISWAVLEASCAILDRLGRLLDVVLALWSRLGNLVREFLLVLCALSF